MGIIKAILIVFEVIVSVLLVGLILIQKSKDEGLGMAFGSGVGETLFGSRAGNVLTKLTIGLAIAFLINTTILSLVFTRSSASASSLVDWLPAGPAPAQAPAPGPGPAPTAPLLPAATAPAAAPAAPLTPAAPAPAAP
jgi:preprotein translocase subunit SecG